MAEAARKLETVFGDGKPVEARVPPHDLDAEAAVLSASMNDRMDFDQAAEILRPEHFYSEAHRRVWEGCLAVGEGGAAPDIVSVGAWLKDHDRLEQVGGMAYLTTILNAAPALKRVQMYAEIVFEHWRVWQVLQVCQRGVAQGYSPLGQLGGPTAYVNGIADSVFELACAGTRSQLVHAKDVVREVFTEIQKANARGATITGLATGFARYDRVTTGLQDGELTIVAARPGMGKTGLVCDIVQNVAGQPAPDEPEPGWVVGAVIFSLEMPRGPLMKRMLASTGRVELGKLRTGMLTKTDWDKLTIGAQKIANSPIWIEDKAAITLVEVRAKLRRAIAEAQTKKIRIKLVALDYLQLMGAVGDERSREEEVARNSRGLKQIAKDLRLPVIALAQVNRNPEERSRDKRPQLSDLRESGAIEADADNIVFIYRDDYYNKESTERNVAELIVAKQRNGPTDTVRVRFDPQFTRFDNLAEGEWDEGSRGGYDA